ncbi:MAG: hypothetical protein HQM09_11065 [Candidatus Riflebacteria bacterium]|nr:hypothetical protein [Candidatus Riflebacteria bacterium]
MKRVILVFALACLTFPTYGDMPTLRLDGTYSKEPLYQDTYPYSKIDITLLQANTLKIGIKKKITKDDSEYSEIDSRITSYPWKAIREKLEAKYTKTVQHEFDLTDKEKEVIAQHPFEFPKEYAETGKRRQTSEILMIKGKEYSFQGNHILGIADLRGNGSKQMIMTFWPNVTYRAYESINIVNQDGDFIFDHKFSEIDFSGHAIFDADGDKRDELVLKVDGSGEIWLVGSANDSEHFDPLPGVAPFETMESSQPQGQNKR